jgi:hypothetical protein
MFVLVNIIDFFPLFWLFPAVCKNTFWDHVHNKTIDNAGQM